MATYTFENLTPYGLNDGGNTPPATITVAGVLGNVTDVNVVWVDLGHGWADDIVSSVSFGGTDVVLYNRGNNNADFSGTYVFDEDVSATITGYGNSNPYIAPGSYNPVGDLDSFNGMNPNGVWSLDIDDVDSIITGSIGGWQLVLETDYVPQVSFAATTYSFAEDAGAVTIGLAMDAPLATDVTVGVQVTGGSAQDGTDFTFTSSVTISAGSAGGTLDLSIIDDLFDEPNETIRFEITSVSGGAVEDGAQATTVTIVDNDASSGAGPRTVVGTTGADTLEGGGGNDRVFAKDGNDFISAMGGNDTVFGAGGNDRILGGSGFDVLYGGTGNDTVNGGADNDWVYAGKGDDMAIGGDGQDKVFGGAGNDTLFGGAGNDTLWGGAGDDLIYGGSGADRFAFKEGSGNDVVYGFNAGEGDELFLDGQSYELSENEDGDVVLTLSGGGTITLDGVSEAAFSDAFIV